MPTISSKINQKEYEVIAHYANCCGESISNVIRKIMIREATFYNCFGGNSEYECGIVVSEDMTWEQEDIIVKEAYNKSRRILGFEEIDEILNFLFIIFKKIYKFRFLMMLVMLLLL